MLKRMRFETKAVHAGGEPDAATGAISPPLQLSTTFERNASDGLPSHGYSYIRDHNPTQTRLEEALAAIDSAEVALAFASGMAAATALFQSLPAGSHIIIPDDGYYAVRILGTEFFHPWALPHDPFAITDLHQHR